MRFSSFVCFIILFLHAFPAWAFRVSPMIARLAPEGNGASQTFTLENTDGHRISLQVDTFRRFSNLDGKETRAATDEFSVYPQQVNLQPGERKTVKVTWTGDRQPDRELSYRLAVTELPGDATATQAHEPSRKKILMQYFASLYVTPNGAKSKLVVDSFKILSPGKGELILKNAGLAHQVLQGIRIFVRTRDGSRVEVRNAQTEEMQGENVLAHSSRRFVLDLPRQLAGLGSEDEKGRSQPQIELRFQ